MSDRAERDAVTFPSRFGYWSLDDRALRINTGIFPFLRHLYSQSKPALVLVVLAIVYVPLGIIVDAGVFNLELSAVLLVAGAFFALLLVLARIVGHRQGLSYRDSIAIEAIVGVVFGSSVGSDVLYIVFTDDDEVNQRMIVTPIGWWTDVDAYLNQVREAFERRNIPIDESGTSEVTFERS